MTETQPFDLLRTEGVIQVRRYPEHLVAETRVSADFEDAGNRAFRLLFGYISGENTAQQSIETTSPVAQVTPQRVAMTAPVVQSGSEGNYTVAFVLPASFTEHSAPLPSRPDVSLRSVPVRFVAAVRFSGRWTSKSYEKHLDQLRSAVADAGLTPIGEPWFARFDPPFKPPFLRHNEALIEVEERHS